MGGGDSSASAQPTQNSQAAVKGPTYIQPNFPAYQPGQREMLAQQMGFFGYGQPQDFMNVWDGIYKPQPDPGILAALAAQAAPAPVQSQGDGLLRALSITPNRVQE